MFCSLFARRCLFRQFIWKITLICQNISLMVILLDLDSCPETLLELDKVETSSPRDELQLLLFEHHNGNHQYNINLCWCPAASALGLVASIFLWVSCRQEECRGATHIPHSASVFPPNLEQFCYLQLRGFCILGDGFLYFSGARVGGIACHWGRDNLSL